MSNQRKRFLTFAIGAGVLLAGLTQGRAAQTTKFTAEVKQVIGSATVNGIAVKKGMIVSEGSILVTGTNSSVAFVIKEFKAVIRLQPQSRLALERMQALY